jgi:nitrogen regulatory protein PII
LVREGDVFKKIKALIDPLNLDEIREALEELGIQGVTASNCRQVSPRKGPAKIFRGKERATDFLSEIGLEMVVDEELAGRVIETIQRADGVGWDKEGKISILPIEEVLSIEPSEFAGYRNLGVGT